MTAEDIAHGQLVDVMPQIRQGSLDPPIAPRRMLLGHLDREPLDLLRHWGPPPLCAARAPVKLLRDEAAIPAEESVWGGNGRHLFKAFATARVSKRSKATSLSIGEAELTATALSFEDAILLLEIGDDVLLGTLDPPGNHGDQDMENHSRT
jgi:hypothetical protein